MVFAAVELRERHLAPDYLQGAVGDGEWPDPRPYGGAQPIRPSDRFLSVQATTPRRFATLPKALWRTPGCGNECVPDIATPFHDQAPVWFVSGHLVLLALFEFSEPVLDHLD